MLCASPELILFWKCTLMRYLQHLKLVGSNSRDTQVASALWALCAIFFLEATGITFSPLQKQNYDMNKYMSC